MTVQIQNTNRRLLQREFWRISELATSAEHKTRIYKAKDGTNRTIKARPANEGLLPFGRSTIYDLVRKGDMPPPIKLSERVSAWRSADLIEWLESKQ
ncbi:MULTISPECIES: helix-turn-helix transcriptional regulator [Acinetobacter]|jgi:prophage regulatory protein|uniref:helix-turn-helix transcriptional regulator n=1 Tax=Acinetobacter TaxID=469 RepID=UPI0010398255|nr:AlpA family phage regulatory protein [Acinetobacter johnsonii]QBK71142.1 AlpA family phage regulatory protein [Acinetobacter johnsonii]